MKTWKLRDAKDHFNEVMQFCHQEPQLVYEHNEPLAVVIDIKLFNDLTALQPPQPRPTIRQLLAELREIQAHESVEIDIPQRQDRFNPNLNPN